MNKLYDIWAKKNPRFEKEFDKSIVQMYCQYGGGSAEGQVGKGKTFNAGYEIFIYALRFCLLSLTLSHNNFYSNLLNYNCFKTLSDNFIPGKTISRNIFKESYDVIKENLTKDPLNYGAYLCSA